MSLEKVCSSLHKRGSLPAISLLGSAGAMLLFSACCFFISLSIVKIASQTPTFLFLSEFIVNFCFIARIAVHKVMKTE